MNISLGLLGLMLNDACTHDSNCCCCRCNRNYNWHKVNWELPPPHGLSHNEPLTNQTSHVSI